jgi:hypothetical protein
MEEVEEKETFGKDRGRDGQGRNDSIVGLFASTLGRNS